MEIAIEPTNTRSIIIKPDNLAAAYCYRIAKNHPFIDGNKRTGFILMAVFLELNGYSFDVPEMEVVLMMERLATDLEDQESIATWLQEK